MEPLHQGKLWNSYRQAVTAVLLLAHLQEGLKDNEDKKYNYQHEQQRQNEKATMLFFPDLKFSAIYILKFWCYSGCFSGSIG